MFYLDFRNLLSDRLGMMISVLYALFREVMSGSFVLWMDNYSHIYRIQHLIRKTGPYRSCLWAGEAVHQYHCPDHPVSLNYISDPRTNRRVLAMPPDLFHELDSIKITLARRDGEGNRYYDSSLCVKYKVNNVPLKPEVNPEVNPQLAELLAEGRDGLKYFHPMHIYQLNPGSDVGLHRYAAGIAYRIKNVAEMKNRYIPLKVDSNIFYRWLPVRLHYSLTIAQLSHWMLIWYLKNISIVMCLIWMRCVFSCSTVMAR